jgi:hypothetical protein
MVSSWTRRTHITTSKVSNNKTVLGKEMNSMVKCLRKRLLKLIREMIWKVNTSITSAKCRWKISKAMRAKNKSKNHKRSWMRSVNSKIDFWIRATGD